MKEHKINSLDNFICGWYTDPQISDDLIKYFYKNKSKTIEGQTGAGVSKAHKDSTDLPVQTGVNKDKEIMEYYYCLNECVEKYKEKYRYCDLNHAKWEMDTAWNIQKYEPMQGFHKYHCERSSSDYLSSACRHLVFMTYLNDIKDGGETHFYYQDVKIKPEKGLTLIWGADWTFTHKGIFSKTETKYIATGWLSYVTESK